MKVHIGVDAESGLIHSVQTTAANVHQSPHPSQRGASLPCREAAIQLSEDKAEGNGEKSLQSACADSVGKPVHGSPSATRADLKRGLVCLFGRIRAKQTRKRADNQANFDSIGGQSTKKGSD